MPSHSPLRYPGGKQKLAPFLKEILIENNLYNSHYIEPYAGGAGAAIELLLMGWVSSIHLNDSSRAIYAFWQAVLNNSERFCALIQGASLTVDEWRHHKAILEHSDVHDDFELGFSTFYLNRCNRSGVLTGGLIGGLNQMGNYKMDARFPRNELIRRIEAIARRQNQITISNLDAETFIATELPHAPTNTLVYFDPPYYEKASGLYLDFYKKSDHSRLAAVIQALEGIKWVLSYDSARQILDLYNDRRLFTYDLQYSASTVYKGKEVFIFCDDLSLPKSSALTYIDLSLQAFREPEQLA